MKERSMSKKHDIKQDQPQGVTDVTYLLKGDIDRIDGDVKLLRADVNAGFKEMRADNAKNFRWLVGLCIGIVISILVHFVH